MTVRGASAAPAVFRATPSSHRYAPGGTITAQGSDRASRGTTPSGDAELPAAAPSRPSTPIPLAVNVFGR